MAWEEEELPDPLEEDDGSVELELWPEDEEGSEELCEPWLEEDEESLVVDDEVEEREEDPPAPQEARSEAAMRMGR